MEEHLVIKELVICFKGSAKAKFEYKVEMYGLYSKHLGPIFEFGVVLIYEVHPHNFDYQIIFLTTYKEVISGNSFFLLMVGYHD